MSIESAKKFLERIQKDESFKGIVLSLKDDKKKKWDFLKKEGFEFSKEEMDMVKSEYIKELSDEELNLAAGGQGESYFFAKPKIAARLRKN